MSTTTQRCALVGLSASAEAPNAIDCAHWRNPDGTEDQALLDELWDHAVTARRDASDTARTERERADDRQQADLAEDLLAQVTGELLQRTPSARISAWAAGELPTSKGQK